MLPRTFRFLAITTLLSLPFSALAVSPFAQTVPPGRGSPPPRASISPRAIPTQNPRAALRQAQHTARLARVHGILRGMTHKLENLSERLDNQSAAVERRLEALQKAGHTLTVDIELEALQTAIATAQDQIAAIIAQLNTIPESDRPGQLVPQVRELIRTLRGTLEDVRAAFHALQLAVRDDIRASQGSPSPVSATPTP